jgi:ketosteroid isomerase-like protein
MVPTFEAAFSPGDIEQVMALYEPDSVVVAQPSQTVAGTAAVREALLGYLAVRGKGL